MSSETSLRNTLLALGVGGFNATMIIPYMMISPQTTDPKAVQVILLLQHIQRGLFALGATDVPDSGRLDPPTAAALRTLVGDNWALQPWSASARAVVRARANGQRLAPATAALDDSSSMASTPLAVGDIIPTSPVGLLAYALGGFLVYRYLVKG